MTAGDDVPMNSQMIDPDVYDAVVATLKTGSQVAQELSIDRSSLFRLAQTRHVGRMVGGFWLFTPFDVEVLRATRHTGTGEVAPVHVNVTVTHGEPKRRRRKAEAAA